MEFRSGLFIFILIFPFLQVAVHADSFLDFYPDYDDFRDEDDAPYNSEMFDEESVSPLAFFDDTVDYNTGPFESLNQDECFSLMSVDDTNLFSTGRKARFRPRTESCPNQESSTPDIELPSFGLFNLVKPPETPAKPPVQSLPQPPEKDPIKEQLERLFQLPSVNHRTDAATDEDNPCPYALVGDLDYPVCDSGDYERDVQRFAGEYFFDLFNIRYCTYVLDWLTRLTSRVNRNNAQISGPTLAFPQICYGAATLLEWT